MAEKTSNKSLSKEDNDLVEVHDNQQQMTKELYEGLEKIRKDNIELEADLESRSQAYEDELQRLSSSGDHKRLDELLNTDSLGELKEQVKKLHEKYMQQQTLIKKLEFELEMEQGHVKILKHDNKALKQTSVEMTAMAEQEEEYISNKLLKRILGLKKEKGELLLQVEQEEEYMTNMLQKKLNQLQREKIDMENSLEQEQEYIVNKLQKQLDTLMNQQKSQNTSPLMTVHQDHIALLPTSVSPVISKKRNPSSGSINEVQGNTAEMLLSEIAVLKNRTTEMEKEFLLKMQQCNKFKSELIQLRKQAGLSTEDIPLDEGIPVVFRTIPPSPGRGNRGHRSTSTSSQVSLASDKNNINSIPPLQLDDSPNLYPGPEPSRSRSNSTTSSSTAPKYSRRVSGTLLSLAAAGHSGPTSL